MSTLHAHVCTLMIYRWILLRMTNAVDKSCLMPSWLDTDREDRRTRTKTSPSITLFTSNPTCNGLGL
jgi:hypothetical protein